jgi:hypothetical protein
MGDLNHIFEELVQIRKQLEELPGDATEERARLEHRREELHAEAAGQDAAGDERPTHEIEMELVSLRNQVDHIEKSGIDVAVQHGGSALESSTATDAMDLNKQIEAGQGADELRDRIHKLEVVLEHRAANS